MFVTSFTSIWGESLKQSKAFCSWSCLFNIFINYLNLCCRYSCECVKDKKLEVMLQDRAQSHVVCQTLVCWSDHIRASGVLYPFLTTAVKRDCLPINKQIQNEEQKQEEHYWWVGRIGGKQADWEEYRQFLWWML
jgi:hypothetical protein